MYFWQALITFKVQILVITPVNVCDDIPTVAAVAMKK